MTGEVVALGDVVLRALEERLRAMAASALHRDVAALTAIIFRGTLNGVRGWRAAVSTRDGRIYVRCWAAEPGDAAQLVIATLTRSAP